MRDNELSDRALCAVGDGAIARLARSSLTNIKAAAAKFAINIAPTALAGRATFRPGPLNSLSSDRSSQE